jgi:drug/metabolite transporter (DMT)-like permease
MPERDFLYALALVTLLSFSCNSIPRTHEGRALVLRWIVGMFAGLFALSAVLGVISLLLEPAETEREPLMNVVSSALIAVYFLVVAFFLWYGVKRLRAIPGESES